MKTIKKLFTLILTIALAVFTVASPVFAETTTPSITIDGTTDGKTYSLYKIFDLTLKGEGENAKVAYTIDPEWKEFFTNGAGKDYILDEAPEGEKLNQIVIDKETVKYINITQDNIVDFTKLALTYAGPLVADYEEKATGTKLTFDNIALGYYLVFPKGATDVKEEWATIASITSTVPTATVKVKATYPTIEKEADDYSVEVGQIVTFTITGQVPNTNGFTSYDYIIEDTMSDGLLYNEDIDNLQVYYDKDNDFETPDDRTLVDSETYTYTVANNGFTLSFDMTDHQVRKGQGLLVTYQAKVTSAAIDSKTTTNKATLTYSNDPKKAEDKTTTPEIIKYLYSADIDVIKVDGNDNETKLAGATFVLYKTNGQTKKYYKATVENEVLTKVEWVDSKDNATTYTTGEAGTVKFAGLEDGTYHLEETVAPLGYNLLTEPISVTLNNAGEADNKEPKINQVEETVKNYSGFQLPTTGAMGTKLFIGIGTILALISAIVLVTNKRMAKEM